MEISFLELINSILSSGGIIIIIICYCIVEILKSIGFDKTIPKRFIPLFCAVLGAGLGMVPGIFSDINIYFKLIYGFIMGATSTGVFEMIKGIKKTGK